MIYTSELSAVVAALAADSKGNASRQAWQKLYRPGYEDGIDLAMLSRGVSDGSIARADADCWVHARLHSQLIPRHWSALVAKYSTHNAKKVQAVAALCPLIASHAPRLFQQKAVTAWAIPQLRGADGKRSTRMIVLPAHFYDMNAWDNQGLNRTTYWRWRRDIEKTLEGMVTDALAHARQILDSEGLLISNAA